MRELWYVWINYFWASLKSNGPEALVQTVVYGAGAYIFVPPVRRWINGHMSDVHAKLDHIIYHSKDVPPFNADAKPGESPAKPSPPSPEK